MFNWICIVYLDNFLHLSLKTYFNQIERQPVHLGGDRAEGKSQGHRVQAVSAAGSRVPISVGPSPQHSSDV